MTSGANSKFVTRFIAVAFFGLTFVGFAMMFMSDEKSLFADHSVPATISQAN